MIVHILMAVCAAGLAAIAVLLVACVVDLSGSNYFLLDYMGEVLASAAIVFVVVFTATLLVLSL